MDLSARFRTVVRRMVGLPDDPGQAPQVEQLGVYRAQLQKTNGDGSVVDLQPDDKRLSGHQQVQALVSIPGLIAVAKTGAVAALGWMGGDPIKSRLMPLWEIGQGAVTAAAKLVFNADQVQLGGDSGDAVATKKDLQVLYNAINSAGVTAGDGGATLKANIITALGTALWSSGASDGHFCSSTTNAKR